MVGMGLAGAVGMGTAAGVLSPALGGWRNVMVALGCFTLVIGILWISLYKDVNIKTHEEQEKQNIRENFKKVFGVKDIWWAAVFYGLNMVGMMSVITLLPATLIEQGITESIAGALVGIMLGVATAFKIVGGIVSDRVGRRKPFLIISAIVQGICFIVLPAISGIPLITALIIAGAAIGTIVPVFLVLPVEIAEIGTALAATAGGLIFMIGNIGGFLGPIIAGKVMDLTGANWPGFIFMGTSLIIAGFCIFPIRETGQRKKHTS
jgi:cyanate permease